jgi:L-ascorbate metabolism protein UlaG (beta-lactamase superfamily)
MIHVTPLGQVGYRFRFGDTVVYVDPYLSDAAEVRYGPALRRQVPAPFPPQEVRDAQWVLLTHAHGDHTDPATLGPLSQASPRARFVCTWESEAILRAAGIAASRVQVVAEHWQPLAPDVEFRAVPAAHLELDRDAAGRLRFAGYLLRFGGRLLYHAGDTIPHPEIMAAVRAAGAPDWAFIPVNERNHYRSRADIIGNMSVREAFQFGAELGVKRFVPTHWDLFAANSTSVAEIELHYREMRPPFALELMPVGRESVFDEA